MWYGRNISWGDRGHNVSFGLNGPTLHSYYYFPSFSFTDHSPLMRAERRSQSVIFTVLVGGVTRAPSSTTRQSYPPTLHACSSSNLDANWTKGVIFISASRRVLKRNASSKFLKATILFLGTPSSSCSVTE